MSIYTSYTLMLNVATSYYGTLMHPHVHITTESSTMTDGTEHAQTNSGMPYAFHTMNMLTDTQQII